MYMDSNLAPEEHYTDQPESLSTADLRNNVTASHENHQMNKMPASNLTAKLQKALNDYMRDRDKNAHRFSTALSGKSFKSAEFYLADENFNKLCTKAIKKKKQGVKGFYLGGGHFADCYKLTLNDDEDPRSKTNMPEQNYFKSVGKMSVCCKKIDFNKSKDLCIYNSEEANAEQLDDLENEFVREFQNLLHITSTMQSNKEEEAKTTGSASSRSSSAELLQARHVMGCIGVYFKNNSYLLITEHFNGGSLSKWLKKEKNTGKLTWRKMTEFSKQIILGLKFLKSCNIVHRDIAARNICLHYPSLEGSNNGKAESLVDPVLKIIDFGLARILDSNGEDESGVGSAYVANQKTKGFRQLPRNLIPVDILVKYVETPYTGKQEPAFSHKADIWAFGILMWEISTYASRLPYEKELADKYQKEKGETVIYDLSNDKERKTFYDSNKGFGIYTYMIQNYIEEYLAPNYRDYAKYHFSLEKSSEVPLDLEKALCYKNETNRINLRSDMPKMLKKLILKTWKLKNTRPTADDLNEGLAQILESGSKILDQAIPYVEPEPSCCSCSII